MDRGYYRGVGRPPICQFVGGCPVSAFPILQLPNRGETAQVRREGEPRGVAVHLAVEDAREQSETVHAQGGEDDLGHKQGVGEVGEGGARARASPSGGVDPPGEVGAIGGEVQSEGEHEGDLAVREPAPRLPGQFRLRLGRRRGGGEEARGHRDGHLRVRGAGPGRDGRLPGTRGRELPRHRAHQRPKGQRAQTVELPVGAAPREEDEAGAVPPAAAKLPRDVVHPRQHGGDKDAPVDRRLRETLDGRGGSVAEALPGRGRYQRVGGEGEGGRATEPEIPRPRGGIQALRPGDHSGARATTRGRLRRAGTIGGGEEGQAGGVSKVVAILLGHGRRGELDKGEGADSVHRGHRPRLDHDKPPPVQAQSARERDPIPRAPTDVRGSGRGRVGPPETLRLGQDPGEASRDPGHVESPVGSGCIQKETIGGGGRLPPVVRRRGRHRHLDAGHVAASLVRGRRQGRGQRAVVAEEAQGRDGRAEELRSHHRPTPSTGLVPRRAGRQVARGVGEARLHRLQVQGVDGARQASQAEAVGRVVVVQVVQRVGRRGAVDRGEESDAGDDGPRQGYRGRGDNEAQVQRVREGDVRERVPRRRGESTGQAVVARRASKLGADRCAAERAEPEVGRAEGEGGEQEGRVELGPRGADVPHRVPGDRVLDRGQETHPPADGQPGDGSDRGDDVAAQIERDGARLGRDPGEAGRVGDGGAEYPAAEPRGSRSDQGKDRPDTHDMGAIDADVEGAGRETRGGGRPAQIPQGSGPLPGVVDQDPDRRGERGHANYVGRR